MRQMTALLVMLALAGLLPPFGCIRACYILSIISLLTFLLLFLYNSSVNISALYERSCVTSEKPLKSDNQLCDTLIVPQPPTRPYNDCTEKLINIRT